MIEIITTIKNVTLYKGEAKVKRVGQIELAAGNHSVALLRFQRRLTHPVFILPLNRAVK